MTFDNKTKLFSTKMTKNERKISENKPSISLKTNCQTVWENSMTTCENLFSKLNDCELSFNFVFCLNNVFKAYTLEGVTYFISDEKHKHEIIIFSLPS